MISEAAVIRREQSQDHRILDLVQFGIGGGSNSKKKAVDFEAMLEDIDKAISAERINPNLVV